MRQIVYAVFLLLCISACAASRAGGPPAEPGYAGDYTTVDKSEADTGLFGGLPDFLGEEEVQTQSTPMAPSDDAAVVYPQAAPSARGMSANRSADRAPPPPPAQAEPTPEPGGAEPQRVDAAPEKPMVVYQGWLQLRVRRLLEAQNEIVALAEKAGGHVASMERNVIVVKVPGDDFEKAMELFAAVGELLDRRVQAHDVTAQFLDTQARLQVLKEARARLLKLLEAALRKDDQLQILREVKRLTEQIESMEARLRTLRDLVNYFTITIELVPVLQDSLPRQHCSPFPWVRELLPHAPSLTEGKDDIELELPTGFVLFEDDDIYRARAADTTVIRAAVLDNEPLGDAPYWDEAVQHEMECRDEETAETGEAGALTYRIYRNKDVRPRAYLVAVGTFEDRLAVVEVFFPSQETLERHRGAVLESLKSFNLD